MRLVHLADLHIGCVRLDAQSPDGRNQREVDVSETLEQLVDQVIAVQPHFVLVAGDVFDKSRPRNHALTTAFRALRRLREHLPWTPVIVVAGNHDRPTGVGGVDHSLLPHFADIEGVAVVEGEAERLSFGQLSVLCVPEHVAHTAELVPDPTKRFNVLLLHGEIAGVIPGARGGEHAIEAERLEGAWDYIALGHYHVTSQVGPRAWYAGAMDYTSSNVWGELADEAKRGLTGKGFLEVDLETGLVTRHAIAGTRPWIDLPRIDGTDLSAREIDERVIANVEAASINGAVVRQVITNVPRDRQAEMSTLRRKDWIQRALSIDIDPRTPEAVKRAEGEAVAAPARQSLDEALKARISDVVIPDEQPGDRERLLELADLYQGNAIAKLEESIRAPVPAREAA